MSWPWIVLLIAAVAVVLGAEAQRLGGARAKLVGVEARRARERNRQKAKLTLIRSEEEEFAESVQRDLAELPTIEERDRT